MKLCSIIIISLLSLSSSAQQLVLRGDYPDPSVVKIGDTYWASATTSNWGPAYPILRSKDLVNWTTRSHVFMKLPDWADYYFWAPEMTYDNGKVYVYYAAHKKGGNLCVGVASADKPEGPYKDHGPLICQEVGSIDAFPMRDENGKLYMIWKEDANSVGKPTPIWISEMNEERTQLIGQKKELFRNDAPWEGNLVEGVSMIRQGGYFYAFYAAAACCGAACTYGMGVARAKNLLGPWEKYAKNPVVANTDQWTCPGHGTPVEKDGRHYFMYHAYDKKGNIFTGRQGLLIEYKFTPDGWIEFLKGPVSQTTVPLTNSSEGFRGRLSAQWQWSVFRQPEYKLKGGELHLTALPGLSGAMLGHKTLSENYTADLKFHVKKSAAAGGLAVIGDDNNFIAAIHENGVLRVIQLKAGKETEVARQQISPVKKLMIRVKVVNGKDLSFLYSEGGSDYRSLNEKPVDGTYLPPWDRAIRVGLIARGNAGSKAVFDSFQLVNGE